MSTLIKYNEDYAIKPNGFHNNGSICYFNALLQSMLSCTSFIKKIKERTPYNNNNNNNNNILELFNEMIDSSNINNYSNIILNKLITSQKIKDFGGQQCAGEGFSYLFDSIPEIHNLFLHRYCTHLYCVDCEKWVSKVNNLCHLFTIDPELQVVQLDKFKHIDEREKKIFAELSNTNNLSDLNKYIIKQNTYVDKNYKCPNCKNTGEKYKLNYLVMIPEILVIMSKKYNNQLQKINVNTEFTEELFFNTKYGKLKYTAVSQIEHSGGVGGGHYWSVSKRKDGWYLFNDNSFSKCEFKPTNNTYIVFYHLYSIIS